MTTTRSTRWLAAAAAVLAAPALFTTPASATSSSSTGSWVRVKDLVTYQLHNAAVDGQRLACYGYVVSGNGSDPNYLNNLVLPAFHTDAFQAYYRARCNPYSPSAKALSKKNAINLAAYRRGLHTGYVFRYVGNSPVWSYVPSAYRDLVVRVNAGDFYTTQS